MKNFKKILSVVLVFALVFTSMMTFSATTTEAKVKSIKAAKKVTVVVGKSKKVKIKVKTTGKTSKKFTAKSSKKKIATVKVKKGKIIIKGKKVGKCKITIRSKANKKKKKVIKVTVKRDDATLSINTIYTNVYKLTFSKKVNITPANLAVAIKQFKSGKYIQAVKIYDLSTNDQKNYTVILDQSNIAIETGNILRFTVSGVNKSKIVKEVEIYRAKKNRDTTSYYTYLNTDTINNSFYISGYVDGDYGKVKSIKNLPAGLKYTIKDGRLEINGRITKVGIYTAVITFENEKGTTYTHKLIYIIGSSNRLAIYSPKKVGSVYSDKSTKINYESYSNIYVAGGSGNHTLTPTDRAGIFSDSIGQDGYGEYYWYFEAAAAKTYKGTFTAVDNNNASIKANGSSVVEVKKGLMVTGKVTTKSGKPIKGAEVGMEASTYREYDYFDDAETDANGVYKMYTSPGTFDFYASYRDANTYIYSKKITGNTTQNFALGLYQVNVKSNNTQVPITKIGEWMNGDSYVGSGGVLYLKPGTYNLKGSGYELLDTYSASVSFKLTKDMTVTAKVTKSGVPELKIGSNPVVINRAAKIFAFKPTSTRTYYFSSTNSSSDPVAQLLSSDYTVLTDDDDSGDGRNFSMSYNLTAGQTYYLDVWDYDSDGQSTTIVVQ